ncbi:uncharacterized protein HHUB_2167 [Halobacterium hubeiense]|uniref:Uncharacterized protein n=1 Tax=Halobacterium hubeiense TaxID=1407499 RepID=A0A0U5H1V8_9EURY|nr:hypothetical protein [Halobacterium hubeiense]CQH55015.1 uncharacterized protein HHUB_2167 [Halobacterium hubeiense]
MSTDTSPPSTATSTATTSSNSDLPCVQYGFPEGAHRAPKLQTIYEPIPDNAATASPIYKVPREQYERQAEFETGYEVKGGSSIATEIQDECEDDDRVLYPIHIESDAYHEEGPDTLLSWFREFVEDYLGVPFSTCRLYFSGRRSIHVHVPRFVSGEAERKRLKELAESYCEEGGADLDLGLYSRKRLFRLPGVAHADTGIPKVEIEPEWDRTRIFREANGANPSTPATYADVLWDVFGQERLTVGTSVFDVDTSQSLFRVLDPEKTLLEFTRDEAEDEIETPLIEQVAYPDDPADVPEWSMYNTQEFSPYAHASGNPRSVAALRVKGGAFAREGKRGGATMVPAYFYGAVGCNGEFTKADVHAPLQLSKKDYRKWDYAPGEKVVIIGGKSGSSRIFNVSSWDATVVGHALRSDKGRRDTALNHLSERGYDVGASGSTVSGSERTTASRAATSDDKPRTIWPARKNPQSKAEALQRKAEQDGIGTLSHNERIRVACRHLRYGWQPTWEWFKEQYGSTFKPEVTWQFLKGIVEEPDFEKYDDVDVPPKPT